MDERSVRGDVFRLDEDRGRVVLLAPYWEAKNLLRAGTHEGAGVTVGIPGKGITLSVYHSAAAVTTSMYSPELKNQYAISAKTRTPTEPRAS
jgi:hypothetical protein